ncbi:MAG: response regulator [Pseudomonadota bacterium]
MLERALSENYSGTGMHRLPGSGIKHVTQSLSGKTILIVEDELLTGISLRIDAERNGAKVIGPTATLQGTFQAITDVRIDVAILDVRLTDADVFPVADQLRDNQVPIVFHTGHACEKSLMARYPECRVFTKSMSSRHLLNAAAHMLSQHASDD